MYNLSGWVGSSSPLPNSMLFDHSFFLCRTPVKMTKSGESIGGCDRDLFMSGRKKSHSTT